MSENSLFNGKYSFRTLKDHFIRFLVYLEDILLLGPPRALEEAKNILLASNLPFNVSKYHLTPSRIITYLGVTIDLARETCNFPEAIIKKVVQQLIKI